MYNLLISLAVAVVTFLLVIATGFAAWAAIIPALILFIAANFVLAKRVGRQIEALVKAAQREIQANPPRIDKGIKLLEEGFKFEKWQFMIGPELHSNIGILEYVQKEFAQARPHLEKAAPRGPAGARAKAMLGCIYFHAKDEKSMAAAFEQAVRAGKKEGIVWSAYAWCLEKLGKRDDALKVLARACQTNPSDERLKANMVALQNEKRLKMKAYSPEWYQFHLERPPMDLGGGPGGRRVVYQRR